MDMSKYEQMPDLPNADIMFTSELEDMAGNQLADYMSDEEYRIELELIEREQREEEYQRELREFKLSRRIW
jgi:LPS O-antigen subunit length determinant protein (WzzB/FepE family)